MKKSDYSIVISGEAGQGLDTVSEVLIKAFKACFFNVFSTREYMSRVRGGCNSSDIRISSSQVNAPVERIDFLVAFHNDAIGHLSKRISPETVILHDSASVKYEGNNKKIDIPAGSLVKDIGGKIFENVFYAGIIMGMFNLDISKCTAVIKKIFESKPVDVIEKNVSVLNLGYEKGKEIHSQNSFNIEVLADETLKNKMLINGNDAISLGCIAGGCDFISSYPMSPSTAVLTYLAQQAEKFKIIAEQAEDEIAAINMAIGAWYAGARAMVTTSGGGFALMVEGVSLSGMLETPVVIHLAQRPGPATGLPTRTEQGDLELALYSGHGEFPRIILAPGTVKDAFELAQNAFNLADKFQVPVFILTDQYLLESFVLSEVFDANRVLDEHIIKTESGYQRYKLTENGISPRGIPAHGEGFICVDSDEHDEDGHITEDLDLRVKMVDKRLRKLESIKKEIFEPELIGNQNYKNLVIGWGSTYHVIKEAIGKNDETAFLYLKQVYPLSDRVLEYLQKAQKTIIVENNATAQFAKLIRQETGFYIGHKVLKYNGLPFKADELAAKLKEII